HPDCVGSHEGYRRNGNLGQHLRKCVRPDKLNTTAVERDGLPGRRWLRCAAGKACKASRRFADICNHNRHAREPNRAVRVREPARLPYSVLSVVRENLNPSFRHFGWLNTRNREGRRSCPGAGIDWTLQLNERPYAKAILGKAAVCPGSIRHHKCCKLHSGVARCRGLKFTAERCINGLEQNLNVAARQHGGNVSRACQLRRAAFGLGWVWVCAGRRHKASARKSRVWGLLTTHEMPAMVQKNLGGKWKLPIGLCVSAQLLRLRSGGPSRRCSAAKSYELAPSHCL